MLFYAEAFGLGTAGESTRERLRVLNLGGTAIGTGLAAPRQFIFQVTDQLRISPAWVWRERKSH